MTDNDELYRHQKEANEKGLTFNEQVARSLASMEGVTLASLKEENARLRAALAERDEVLQHIVKLDDAKQHMDDSEFYRKVVGSNKYGKVLKRKYDAIVTRARALLEADGE